MSESPVILANGLDDVVSDVGLADLLAAGSRADFSSRLSQEYLSHLTSLPIQDLLAEPTTLQTQSHHLTSSLTSLTHTSYPTFLSLHETTNALKDSLGSFASSLDSLIDESLPALEECAAGWRDRTESVLTERRKARVVLEQHEKLRDLLDIPILIDTCVRNGYFAEALSLASHAASISSSSPPLVVTSVLSEVRQSISQMLYSLLSTLHEPNRKLPALWKAVNFLRKMDAFESVGNVDAEEQIALAFITGRESCLRSNLDSTKRNIARLTGVGQLSEQDADDLTRYLKKYVDLWREGVYDIITQFTTIFLERPSTTSKDADAQPSVPPYYLHTMLASFASHALETHLLPVIESALPHVLLPSLPSLLTQLTYCANAFGRVGLDFRGLLADIFAEAVRDSVSSQIDVAGKRFVALLTDHAGTPASATSPTASKRRQGPTSPTKFLVSSAFSTTPSAVTATPLPKEPHVPPPILASFPPLAELTNAFLATLNNLRLLAPLAIQTSLITALDSALADGGRAMVAYAQAVAGEDSRSSDEPEGTDEAVAAAEAYFRVLVPFMRRALGQGVYGAHAEYRVLLDGEHSSRLSDVFRDWEAWLQNRQS